MSHTDDLALVTACREHVAPLPEHWSTVQITCAALSLIEDTLNDHAPVAYPDGPVVPDYARARAALHAIATALGVEQP